MIVSWSARYTITRSSGSNPVQWKEIGCLGRRSLGGSDGLFGPQLVDGCVGWVGWLVDQLVGWSAGWLLFISGLFTGLAGRRYSKSHRSGRAGPGGFQVSRDGSRITLAPPDSRYLTRPAKGPGLFRMARRKVDASSPFFRQHLFCCLTRSGHEVFSIGPPSFHRLTRSGHEVFIWSTSV